MIHQQPPPQLKSGEYVVTRGADTDAERADIRRQLKNNGCRSVRFDVQSTGLLIAHGYLAAMHGPMVEAL